MFKPWSVVDDEELKLLRKLEKVAGESSAPRIQDVLAELRKARKK